MVSEMRVTDRSAPATRRVISSTNPRVGRLVLVVDAEHVRPEGDARHGTVEADRVRPDLLRAPQDAAHVVEAGAGVGEPLLTRAVGLLLGPHERVHAEHELVRVDRVREDVPRACAERLEPFRLPTLLAVIMSMGVVGWMVGDSRSLRTRSMPSMSGRCTSTMTTSGFTLVTSSSACCPV
jgi:hypothetical protein